jgi:hypothetical protein
MNPRDPMNERMLHWFLEVPVTPASLSVLGALALPDCPIPRGLQAEWCDLAVRLADEVGVWADGVAEAGDRARALMAKLEALRQRIKAGPLDTRALPTCGTQAFDANGFAVRSFAPGVAKLRRKP